VRFIELIVSGVPGTQGVLHFPLEPGLNAWKPKGPFRLETVVDLLAALLYPSPLRTGMLGPGKASAAGLTFESRGVTYRIQRDFARGTTQLAQLEPGTQDTFKETSREISFIRETMIRSAQVPPQRAFRTLLVSRFSDSIPVEERSGAGPVPSAPKNPSFTDPETTLAGLRSELETHQVVTEINSRLDGLHSKLFAAEEKLRRLDDPRKQLEELDREYEEYRVLDQPGLLHPQLTAKLKGYAVLLEKRDGDLAATEETRKKREEELAGTSGNPWWREPLGMAGTLLVPVSFVAIGAARHLRWLTGLLWAVFFAGLILAAIGFLRGYRRVERRKLLQKELRDSETERAGIEKRFEIETAAVRKFFQAVGNDNSSDLLKMMERHAALSPRRQAAVDALAAVQEEVREAELLREREEASREISELERRLSELPPVTGGVDAVQREISRVEEELQRGGERVASVPSAATPGIDPDRLLETTAHLIGRPAMELLSFIRTGLAANLAAASKGRFRGAEFRGDRFSGFRSADGAVRTWEEIDPPGRAVLLFGVQFTLWQALNGAKRPLPVVLDLTSATRFREEFDPVGLQAARFLATQTQVLVLGG
jgi:hypothetical protein